MFIRKYVDESDYSTVLDVIRSEGEEWQEYLVPKYHKALQNSISFVAEVDGQIVGYSRSVNDSDIFIWVIDLLVEKRFRGHGIGRKLMECLHQEFPGLDVYVMSDVDEYYTKLGYKKEGSIFKVEPAIS